MNRIHVRKHAINSQTIEKYILTFILIVVLFSVIATVFPMVGDSADSLNDSGFPLASFFAADGVLWLLVAAAVLFMVYKSFTGGTRK